MAESLSNVDDDLNNEVSLMVEFYFVMLLCRANKIKISTVRKMTQDLSPEVSSTCGPCPIARSYAVASTSGCLSCAPAMSYRTLTAHHKCKMMHQEASRRLLFEGINAAAARSVSSTKAGLNYVQWLFVWRNHLFHLQTRVMWSSTRTKGEDDRKEVPPNASCCGGLCCCRCCYSFTTAIRMDSE
ncbi:unnamed protein product, partial [Musa acuminata var. zebrina]